MFPVKHSPPRSRRYPNREMPCPVAQICAPRQSPKARTGGFAPWASPSLDKIGGGEILRKNLAARMSRSACLSGGGGTRQRRRAWAAARGQIEIAESVTLIGNGDGLHRSRFQLLTETEMKSLPTCTPAPPKAAVEIVCKPFATLAEFHMKGKRVR